MNRALFLDRDGVINRDVGYVGKAVDFQLIAGIAQLMSAAQSLGYLLIVVTNQSGIARGYFSEADYAAVEARMNQCLSEQGVRIAAVYHCPHHPEGGVTHLAISCDCRKPAPGMILQAAREHQIDLAASVLLGDKPSDLAAGRVAGIQDVFMIAPNSGDARVYEQVIATLKSKSHSIVDDLIDFVGIASQEPTTRKTVQAGQKSALSKE